MYNNDYMYAIERNDEYLAHYGIRGMRWGVRKAIARGNSRALRRQYQKAAKKLAKLDKQAANSKKYWRRAGIMGAGAAAAGGLAAAGTGGLSSAMTKIGAHGGQAMIKGGKLLNRAGSGFSTGLYNLGKATGNSTLKKIGAGGGQAMIKAGNAIGKAGTGMSTGMYTAGKAVRTWGNSKTIGGAMKVGGRKLQNAVPGNITAKLTGGKGIVNTTDKLAGVTNNTFARIGAGAIGVGLAAGAARNAYKAKTAQKRAAQFRSEMNKAFAGTQYAKGGNGGSKPRQGKKRRRS